MLQSIRLAAVRAVRAALAVLLLVSLSCAVALLSGCTAAGMPVRLQLPDRGPFAACVSTEVAASLGSDVIKPAILETCSGELDIFVGDCVEKWGAAQVIDPTFGAYLQGGVALAVAGAADLIAGHRREVATAWVVALEPSVQDLGRQIVDELAGGDGHLVVSWRAPAVGACQ